MTSICGSDSRISFRTWRTDAESSTISTLSLPRLVIVGRLSSCRFPVHGCLDGFHRDVQTGERFRMAGEQVSSRRQIPADLPDYRFLRAPVKVDHHVTEENDVEYV